MSSVEAAAADYMQFRKLKQQIAWLNDDNLAAKFECSDRSIRKIRAGESVSTICDEDRDLILSLLEERRAMWGQSRGKSFAECCTRHRVGKTTLINHLISIGQWEDSK
ncbi:hypothetical protein [uncultured Marinobacter sp.]|uniref:hypothetical protein n=1 Tax=uncultured Marinobacter sp. TaxID=187379 RepID=UPI0030D742D7